jgi:hypothetical protein
MLNQQHECMESSHMIDAFRPIERVIQRLLDDCLRSFQAGNTKRSRQDMNGVMALRRIVERLGR